jgi:ABC-2 type transporter
MIGVMIYLFFATAIGIFLGTVARSMPQLGLLFMLVYLPMNMLSGSNTPLESMPPWLATAMQASPSTHFVSFAQAPARMIASIVTLLIIDVTEVNHAVVIYIQRIITSEVADFLSHAEGGPLQRDAPQFGLMQVAVALILFVFVLWVLAFWPERWIHVLNRLHKTR